MCGKSQTVATLYCDTPRDLIVDNSDQARKVRYCTIRKFVGAGSGLEACFA